MHLPFWVSRHVSYRSAQVSCRSRIELGNRICMKHVSDQVFWLRKLWATVPSQDSNTSMSKFLSIPDSDYSSLFWFSYSRASSRNDDWTSKVMTFCSSRTRLFFIWNISLRSWIDYSFGFLTIYYSTIH